MELFQLSKEAKSDLRSIAQFTEKRWGITQRNLYLKQLDDAFRLLAENAHIGTECEYIRIGYKKFPVGSHVVFYKYSFAGSIFIVRILHKGMDVGQQL